MVNVSAQFHSIAADSKTRIRIYTINDTVDCTDDNDVETNGTLLVLNVGDADSNGRISSKGVSVTDYYNQEQQLTIGGSVSCQFSTTFINNDGGMNTFPYGRFKAYIDAYDATNQTWEPCPLGVYTFETPIKRKVQLISTVAWDQMRLFDAIADEWFNNLDFTTSGLSLYDILADMATSLGVTLKPGTQSSMINGSITFNDRPFTSAEMTYRDILGWIAEANCSIARFDRNGYLELKWFSDAQIGNDAYSINADALGTGVFSVDISEYTVPAITGLIVRGSQTDIGVTLGTTSVLYEIVDNGFLYGADEAEITTKATPIYNALSAFAQYIPITLTTNIDWSIESGDIIELVYDSTTYRIPIFQQSLTWIGGHVKSTLFSSGLESREVASYQSRYERRSNRAIHELELTAETLRSMIQSIDGNYSLIEQTVESITQAVSTLDASVTDILDPSGEMWSFMQQTRSDLDSEITEINTYIRFTNEPAIILGTEDGQQIKLKLLNNVIYFFNGADDAPLSSAFAYFDSESVFVDRLVAKSSVQIGDDQTGNWVWHKLDNGNFALDLI